MENGCSHSILSFSLSVKIGNNRRYTNLVTPVQFMQRERRLMSLNLRQCVHARHVAYGQILGVI